MKIVSFAVPCYNSAEYMDKCIESLVVFGDDVEVLLVDDGSSDDTYEKALAWQEKYPGIVRAIHKENGGHGSAVNTGLDNACGMYYKVVDSDDWLGERAMREVIDVLKEQEGREEPLDMLIANYVYEKVFEDKSTTMRYRRVLPERREFSWDEIGNFGPSRYILMHSVVYRTQLLKDIGLRLPEHCFYVDNVFVYEPLPYVKSIYYMDVDIYHYFIGREGQSVNEATMMKRIDQQVRVTKTMIEAIDVEAVEPRKLRKYMENYLAMMLCICSVFLRMKNTPEDDETLHDLWAYLKEKDPDLHRKMKMHVVNLGTNLPTEAGRRFGLGGYHLAQKIFKFN